MRSSSFFVTLTSEVRSLRCIMALILKLLVSFSSEKGSKGVARNARVSNLWIARSSVTRASKRIQQHFERSTARYWRVCPCSHLLLPARTCSLFLGNKVDPHTVRLTSEAGLSLDSLELDREATSELLSTVNQGITYRQLAPDVRGTTYFASSSWKQLISRSVVDYSVRKCGP